MPLCAEKGQFRTIHRRTALPEIDSSCQLVPNAHIEVWCRFIFPSSERIVSQPSITLR